MDEERFSDEKFNQALAALVEPPADLTERLLAACRQEADFGGDTDEAAFLRPETPPASRRLRWHAWFSHAAVAAGVAVICSVLAVRVMGGRVAAAPQRVAMAPSEKGVALVGADDAVPMEEAAAIRPMRAFAAKEAAKPVMKAPQAAVDNYQSIAQAPLAKAKSSALQGFSLADSRRLHTSFAGDAGEAMAASSVGGTALPSRHASGNERSEIADTVTQVWLTDTLPPSRADIDAANKKLGDIMHLELMESDEEKCTLIRVTAEDSAIQQLVDDLHGRHGLTLLSPSLPQPGEENAAAFTGKQVTYLLKLLHR